MNEESSPDKSPRSPVYTLETASGHVERLHKQIGKATVKVESAVVALGYKSVSGAALTTLGTLAQYGLIDRSKGSVTVTPLAIRILHPTSEVQKREAIREAALSPKIFKEIYDNLGQCSADVLTSHLVQSDFTPDRAKRIANVYVANKAFANLDDRSMDEHADSQPDGNASRKNEDTPPDTQEREGGVIAQYSIPLGGNEATLIFRGDSLTASDFDALKEYVELFKKQFERKAQNPSDLPHSADE